MIGPVIVGHADVVRGRLGRWTTLEFSKEERAGFVKLLGEIPADADFGPIRKRTARVPTLAIGPQP